MSGLGDGREEAVCVVLSRPEDGLVETALDSNPEEGREVPCDTEYISIWSSCGMFGAVGNGIGVLATVTTAERNFRRHLTADGGFRVATASGGRKDSSTRGKVSTSATGRR